MGFGTVSFVDWLSIYFRVNQRRKSGNVQEQCRGVDMAGQMVVPVSISNELGDQVV